MIILLYGQDNFRLRQKLNEIINYYQKADKSNFNLIFFNNQNINFIDFKNIFRQASIFNEKKLVILANAFSDKIFKEKFLKEIKEFINSNNIVLIYQEGEISSKDDLFSFLEKQSQNKSLKQFEKEKSLIKIQEFNLLKGEKLKAWALKEFSKFNAKISPEALKKMIDFIGNDLWRFSNEIKKLINYKNNQEILPDDVELLVKPELETIIWKTIDAIGQRDKKKALFLINQHLKKGENPFYLLSMINFQFRNLLTIKDFIEKGMPFQYVLKVTRLHPFVVKKSFELADKFTFQELKYFFNQIFWTDLNIKTGKVDPKTAIDLLIAGI